MVIKQPCPETYPAEYHYHEYRQSCIQTENKIIKQSVHAPFVFPNIISYCFLTLSAASFLKRGGDTISIGAVEKEQLFLIFALER